MRRSAACDDKSISPTLLVSLPASDDDDDDDDEDDEDDDGVIADDESDDALEDVDVDEKVAGLQAQLEQDLAWATRLSQRLLRSMVRGDAPGEGANYVRDMDHLGLVCTVKRIRDTLERLRLFEELTRKRDAGERTLDAEKAMEERSLLRRLDDEMSDLAAFDLVMREREREVRRAQKRDAEEREERQRASEAQERWPDEQRAVKAEIDASCRHYRRNCLVSFGGCCGPRLLFACHHCHNDSLRCPNKDLEPRDATHLKCRTCGTHQAIGPESGKCKACATPTADYFCAICKHFASAEKNAYHCEKCGGCRAKKDLAYHCDGCGMCLYVALKGKHKCRPDRPDDDCGICMEKLAYKNLVIFQCGHAVHTICLGMMRAHGAAHKCPICRQSTGEPALP